MGSIRKRVAICRKQASFDDRKTGLTAPHDTELFKRLKQLEKENKRFQGAVLDLILDALILKAIFRGRVDPCSPSQTH